MSDEPNPDRHLARLGIRYLSEIPGPGSIPATSVVVHNSVRPSQRLGERGFRAWLQPRSLHLEPCPCRWAAELGEHYRMRERHWLRPRAYSRSRVLLTPIGLAAF